MNPNTFQEQSIPLEKYPLRFHIANRNTEHPSIYPMHWHEHMELLYFPEGNCTVKCSGKIIKVNKGDLVVVNCNELHSTIRKEHSSLYCIRISPSFITDVEFENVTLKSHIKNDNFIQKQFEEIAKEQTLKNKGYDMQTKAYTYLILTHLFRYYQADEEDKNNKKKRQMKINEILQYISIHYQSKLSTAHLAKKFFLSECYFCHFFKNETGLSPMCYLNKFRVEKAARYLKESDYTITEIALKVGFEDSNYFSKIFKKYMGKTPREYKQTTNTIPVTN